ncbi:MAG: DnaA ATPase domain-containing protein [Planctomycetia bacterium]
MAKRTDAETASAGGQRPLAGRIEAAVCERIGTERFAVWFGDSTRIDVATPADEASPLIVVHAGAGCTHDFLQRTFGRDFEAVVRELCGAAARLEWRPLTGESTGRPVQSVAGRRPSAQGLQARSTADVPRSAARRRGRSAEPHGPAAAGQRPEPAAAGGRRRPVDLESFVVGPCNRMAYGAAELAVTRPGEMSPLVIHGPSGVGKTHLLEGICGRVRRLHPTATISFLSAEQFTSGFLQALHGSGLPGFRRSCRNADLLVVDDLQFFVGKRATRVELQQTIDHLQRQGRQMVFSCDREPDAIEGLGTDLLTRLRGGITARILPPDYEVRQGIVAGICAARGLEMPAEVIHYVASHMTRHARELSGAVNRLEATSLMLGMPIGLEMAEEALVDLVRASGRSVRIGDIDKAVCKAFGIESGTLQSARRAKATSHPRMLAMFLARKHTKAALTDIGGYFGRRSHSTVIAAEKAVTEWVAGRAQIVLADASWDVEEAIRRVEDLLRAS